MQGWSAVIAVGNRKMQAVGRPDGSLTSVPSGVGKPCRFRGAQVQVAFTGHLWNPASRGLGGRVCRRRARQWQCRATPRDATGVPETLEMTVVETITAVGESEWDALVGDDGSPFLEHEWLRCMEASACASAKAGWYPRHVTIRDGEGRLVAAAPVYIKTNSMGEFVFDQFWADAAYSSGIQYYPKLLCGVPFTPATGRRLLTDPGSDRGALLRILARALRRIVEDSPGVSSIHVNFCEDDEVEMLSEAGFLHRKSIQYHFVNEAGSDERLYNSFDDYLASMKSKRRIKVKRERRSIYEDAGLTLHAYFGDEIPDDMFETMFRIYRSTVDKFFYGIKHLNKKFFLMLREKFKKNLCFIVAKRGDEVVAGTFNVVKAGRFYGRYWGTFDESVRNLHFETCYYKPIEVCLDHGFRRMEPGAGGDKFKFMRGFDPTVTNSMHFCNNSGLQDAIKTYLNSERNRIDEVVEELSERSVLRARDEPAEEVLENGPSGC